MCWDNHAAVPMAKVTRLLCKSLKNLNPPSAPLWVIIDSATPAIHKHVLASRSVYQRCNWKQFHWVGANCVVCQVKKARCTFSTLLVFVSQNHHLKPMSSMYSSHPLKNSTTAQGPRIRHSQCENAGLVCSSLYLPAAQFKRHLCNEGIWKGQVRGLPKPLFSPNWARKPKCLPWKYIDVSKSPFCCSSPLLHFAS